MRDFDPAKSKMIERIRETTPMESTVVEAIIAQIVRVSKDNQRVGLHIGFRMLMLAASELKIPIDDVCEVMKHAQEHALAPFERELRDGLS